MENLIIPDAITGNSVYGVQQVEYTVDGVSGKNFADAVTIAAFKQAAAIEAALGSYTRVVSARQVKVDELGEALSYVAKTVASLRVKGGKSTDKVDMENAAFVKTIANRYGVKIDWESNGKSITRGNVQKAQTNFQYEMDKESNNLQQDTVTMQSFLTKRDNAYSNASKIVRKTLDAASSTISNMGY